MLLFDNSAFARLDHPQLPTARAEQLGNLAEDDGIAICLPFVLEAGYSARNADEHDELRRWFGSLPWVPITSAAEARAVEAQAQLARIGHHRVTPVDLIIAAAAHEAGAGVLHYDRHYDVIAGKTSLEFASEWLAPPGSLD